MAHHRDHVVDRACWDIIQHLSNMPLSMQHRMEWTLACQRLEHHASCNLQLSQKCLFRSVLNGVCCQYLRDAAVAVVACVEASDPPSH
ncbi:unnamed protein product [Periconia digitata]|uniref:Uncharacterized protein n=1 Tax=Periconia digitata TaxID=1303443 RepID=A0A9W4UMW5_9PLEO|nr:unnamed protein product [Periconia digitata]